MTTALRQLAGIAIAFCAALLMAPAGAVAANVAPAVGCPSVPTIVSAGRSFVLTGTVTPSEPVAADHVTLTFYRRSGGVWVLERSARSQSVITSSTTAYSVVASIPVAGTWRVRAAFGAETAEGAEPSRSETSTDVRVSPYWDATIWNHDGVNTIPERMAYRSNASQMIIATGSEVGAKYGTLRFFDYRNGDWVQTLTVPCRFGTNGLMDGVKRTAGNRTTPTGIWVTPSWVFGNATLPPKATRVPYRHITGRSWWSSERNATYNTWVETSRHVTGEHLADYPSSYEWALSTGYNALPNTRVFGRGSAIFLHCFGSGLTAGCVSVSRSHMGAIIWRLDPTKRRVFAIGTTRLGTSTSILGY